MSRQQKNYTERKTAELLGISIEQLRRLTALRLIHSIKVFGEPCYTENAIQRYKAKNK